jgi:phosphatidylglycerophosphate synthase
MINKCIILAPSEARSINGISEDGDFYNLKILGLTTLERIVLSANENGITDFLIVTESDPSEFGDFLKGRDNHARINFIKGSLREGINPDLLSNLKNFARGDNFLLAFGDYITDRRLFKELLGQSLAIKNDILVAPRDIDPASLNLEDPGIYLCNLMTLDLEEGAIFSSHSIVPKSFHEVKKTFWYKIANDRDIRIAEKKLLKSLIKEADSFLSRYFTRPISLSMTRHFARYNITPNQITYLNMVVGIISALFVTSPTYILNFIGLAIFEFTVILDGCDGEVARVKFMSSKNGAKIDTVVDFITRVLFFTAAAIVNLKFHQTGFDYFIGITASALSAITMVFSTILLLKYNIPDEGCFSAENMNFRKDAGLMKKSVGIIMKPEGFTTLFFLLGVFQLYRSLLVLAAMGYIGFIIFNIVIAVRTFRLRAAQAS